MHIFNGILINLNNENKKKPFTQINTFRKQINNEILPYKLSKLFISSLIDICAKMVLYRHDAASLVAGLNRLLNVNEDDAEVLQSTLWSLTCQSVCRVLSNDPDTHSSTLIIFPEFDGQYSENNTHAIPAMMFGEPDLKQALLKDNTFSDFHYSSTSKPKDITEEEWLKRRDLWSTVFKESKIPYEIGLTIQLMDAELPQYILPSEPKPTNSDVTSASGVFYNSLYREMENSIELIVDEVPELCSILNDFSSQESATCPPKSTIAKAAEGMFKGNVDIRNLNQTILEHLMASTT